MQYHDPDAPKRIAEATGNMIHKALDSISEESSQKIIIHAMAPGTGKVVVLLTPSVEAQAMRDDVLIQCWFLHSIFVLRQC